MCTRGKVNLGGEDVVDYALDIQKHGPNDVFVKGGAKVKVR
jgi:hypothetical protein